TQRGPAHAVRADQARYAVRHQRFRGGRAQVALTSPRRDRLSVRVAPLPAATRGLEAELLLHLPSDVALIEEAVELVARHLEAHFVDRRTIRFNLRVALSE